MNRHKSIRHPLTRPLVTLLGCTIVCAIAALQGGCASTPAAGKPMISKDQAAGGAQGGRPITQEELTQRLMAFADRYISRISEATDQLKRNATDPAVRRAAHATKFFPASAILNYAAEPDPVAGMLDIATVCTLERMVWQDTGWAVEVFGADGAEVLRKAQVDMEKDIWSCAAAVLPADRLRDVRKVIEDWQHAHPTNRYVSTMRFDDFAADGGEMSRRAAVAARAATGGFLAPINEATRAVDETRMWGERFIFITGRMQRMMSWQAELLVYELALAPEAKQIMANHLMMAEGIRRFATAVEAWPDVLAHERVAWLKGIADQTGATGELVTNVRAAMTEAQPVAADVRRTSESAVQVASELRGAVRDAKPLVEEIARLKGKPADATPSVAPPATGAPLVAAALAGPGAAAPASAVPIPAGAPADVAPAPETPVDVAPQAALPVSAAPAADHAAADQPNAARPFDVKEYESLVREMHALVQSTDSLLASRAWASRLSEVNSAAETRMSQASREGRELVNYSFYRGAFFALFCAVVLFCTALLYRLTVRRLFPMSPRPSA